MTLQIRPAQLKDLAAIEAVYREHAHEIELPHQGGTTGLKRQPASTRLWFLINHTFAAILPITSSADHVYVGESPDAGGLVGFVQAQTAPAGKHAWEIINLCLLPGLDRFKAGTALLDHLCNEGLKRGVAKFMVRVSINDPTADLFRARGFYAYATEHALLAESIGAMATPEVVGWRSMRQKDQLALYLLYRAVTPAEVSAVEAQTFQEWRQTFQGGSWTRAVPRTTSRRQFLVDRVEVMGWMGVTPGGGGRPHSLGLIALGKPDDLWPSLIQRSLAYTAEHLQGPVWCSLRHYNQRAISLLQKEGFEVIASQVLLSKELGVKVPARARAREKRLVPQYG